MMLLMHTNWYDNNETTHVQHICIYIMYIYVVYIDAYIYIYAYTNNYKLYVLIKIYKDILITYRLQIENCILYL